MLNSTVGIGGVPRVMSIWGNYFVKKGYEVEFVSNDSKDPFYEIDSNITHTILGLDKFGKKGRIKFLIKIYHFFKNRKNEIFIVNKSHFIAYIFILKKLGLIDRSNKFCYFVHGGNSDFKFLYNNYKSQLINNVCSSIIALIDNYDSHNSINHTGEKDLLEVLKEDHGKSLKGKLADVIFPNPWLQIKKKIIFIPNPVSFKTKRKINNNSKTVLALTSLKKRKGLNYLIRAWEILSMKHPDWELEIVGSGIEKESLEKLITQLEIKSIKMTPATKDVLKHYLNSSIFINSSVIEGYGMPILEAMECGLPVVAFENVGSKFFVENNITGLLGQNGNVKLLAENISKLISDSDLRIYMGKNGIKKAEEFYVENLYKIWKPILS